MDNRTQIVFMIFTAAIVVSVLIQCAALVGMALAAAKAQKKINTLVDDLRLHILPVVHSSRVLIEDLSPKIKVISADLVDTTNKLKTMSEEVSGVVSDVTQRTRMQAAHVDDMLEGTLHQIGNAANTIQHGISVPVRQLTALLNGFRAAFEVLLNKAPDA